MSKISSGEGEQGEALQTSDEKRGHITATVETQKILKCYSCDHELEGEDHTSPFTYEGELYCEGCYVEECERECNRCFNCVIKDEVEMHPGELLALWVKTDGLEPGYYRVLRWPIYMDGMIEGYVITDNLQFVLPLDDKGKAAAEEARYPGGRLCLQCRTEIEPTGTAADSVPETNEIL